MKKYLIKANALFANRRYETGLFLLAGVIGILYYFTFVSNKIIFSTTIPSYLKQTEIISCAPNSFYNEPFDPSLEEVQINDNRKPAGEMRNGIYYIRAQTTSSTVSIKQNGQLVNWRQLAKDGITLPGNQQVLMPGSRQ